MRNMMLVLGLAVLAGCGVSEKEAKEALEGIEAIASAPSDIRPTLYGNMCMESSTCAGECKEVFAVLGNAARKDRILLVAQCDTSVKPIPETDTVKAFDDWLKKRVGAYLIKVRKALTEEERARLDKAWAAAQSDS